VDLADVYAWARRRGRWEAPPASQLRQFKEEMARAAREEHYTDPQGRRVRRKHAAVVFTEAGRQLSLWADIETAQPAHMRLALEQRRRGVLGDLAQLKADMDSYNQNNNPRPDEPIQLSFNFEGDLAETGQGPACPDKPPGGEGPSGGPGAERPSPAAPARPSGELLRREALAAMASAGPG
jgi:hypothetical protein